MENEWCINEVLQVLLTDVGVKKFMTKSKNIKVDFPRRKTYDELWIMSSMPWEEEYSFKPQTPRKWNSDDLVGFKFYIETKYNKVVPKSVIIDALKCLKNRCEHIRIEMEETK